MIKILQGNLHRSKIVNDLLYQITFEKQADVLLLCEQYENLTPNEKIEEFQSKIDSLKDNLENMGRLVLSYQLKPEDEFVDQEKTENTSLIKWNSNKQ